ncbi:hypothetical protein OIU74_004813 [Salix koriyanagi]|uniref:Uncharacterized protein n=1 Tax=Salix koriyanagi TaxID=2511006 RepID=A0A9Q0UMX3_9ROSI|nr:hypothetical protein OIU74_004813 [Salix koriyanagi]
MMWRKLSTRGFKSSSSMSDCSCATRSL